MLGLWYVITIITSDEVRNNKPKISILCVNLTPNHDGDGVLFSQNRLPFGCGNKEFSDHLIPSMFYSRDAKNVIFTYKTSFSFY
jgi:hypothetical protein